MATSSATLRRPSQKPALQEQGADEKAKPDLQEKNLEWSLAFVALFVCRYLSSKSNIIHDCDEVFNYWEPLHYLLYKSGFQTWEYSSEFALRSYLYLVLHAIVAGPASLWYGAGVGKVEVFYALRLGLGTVSAATEATLCAAVSKRYGRRLASYTLVLLCFTSGMYIASTSFLPSTFSMYGITLASAALLAKRPSTAVAVAAFSVIMGWPFSVLAAFPLVLYALTTGGFFRVFVTGVATSLATLVSSLLVDRYFYGKWTSSVLNLVAYNVVGGGGSELYGVEGPTFYLRNLLNNFNMALIFALLSPLALRRTTKGPSSARFRCLYILQFSAFLWLGFMSLQAHKEERFLYPVYPLICLAAAVSIERIPDLIPQRLLDLDDRLSLVSKLLRPVAVTLILVLSYSRNTALLAGYFAPMDIYRHLPAKENYSWNGTSQVCVGSEWHRFPSSFFLPSPMYEVKWLDDGFRGLLPLPFDNAKGGTRSAPAFFNNQNMASPEQFLVNEDTCTYLVELQFDRPGRSYRGHDRTLWQVVRQIKFLDNEISATLSRALFVPWHWEKVNVFAWYQLLQRVPQRVE